jgi:hypothetical protein
MWIVPAERLAPEAVTVKMVTLNYARADELAYTRLWVAPPWVRIIAHRPTNSLIISGPPGLPERVAVKSLLDAAEIVKLAPEAKHLTDTINMLAARAETRWCTSSRLTTSARQTRAERWSANCCSRAPTSYRRPNACGFASILSPTLAATRPSPTFVRPSMRSNFSTRQRH